MANQTFDFELFTQLYNQAESGLQDVMQSVRNIIPVIQDVAAQTGSAKLSRTTDSFVQVTEEQIACFDSLQECADELKSMYGKIDASVN